MAEVKWIKLSTDVFENRKVRQIELMQHGNEITLIWIRLLCLAGSINDNGNVYFTKDIPFDNEMLANQFNTTSDVVEDAINIFKRFGMLVNDEHIQIKNWEKYQNVDGMERIREGNRNRQKKWYDSNKSKNLTQPNVRSNVSLTQPNAIDKNRIEEDKNRLDKIDKNREETKIVTLVERAAPYLSHIKPKDLNFLYNTYSKNRVYMVAANLWHNQKDTFNDWTNYYELLKEALERIEQ